MSCLVRIGVISFSLGLFACGRSDRPSTYSIRFDVGGAVAYRNDPATPLAGVRVTLSSVESLELSTTTNSAGLWTISDLEPGVYAETYDLDGYEPVFGSFSLDAFGENDFSNVFVSRPTVELREFPIRASVLPLGATLTHGDALIDGVGGNEFVYDVSADGAILVTFNYRVYTAGYAYLEDGMTGTFATASLDSATSTIFTFSEAQLDAMNGGSGLTADQNPSTLHYLYVTGDSFTPIHGEPTAMVATLRFNAVP